MRFGEEQVKKYIERYTGILIETLGMEDPRHKGVNYYAALHETVTRHYRDRGMAIEEVDAFMTVKHAIAEIAGVFLKNGESFSHLYPADIFGRIKPVLAGNLEKSP